MQTFTLVLQNTLFLTENRVVCENTVNSAINNLLTLNPH